MSFSSTWAYTVITASFYPILALLLSVILFRHCWLLFQYLSSQDDSQFLRKQSSVHSLSWRHHFANSQIHAYITTYSTPLFIFSALIASIQGVLTKIMTLTKSPLYCRTVSEIAGRNWWMGKMCIYSVFISRLHLSFKDSIYRYSVDFILGLYLLNFMICVGSAISISWVYDGIAEPIRQGPLDNLKACVFTFPHNNVGAFIIVLNDTLWTIGFIYLFCKPLRSLIISMSHTVDVLGSNANGTSEKLLMLPVKYTLLTIIATISTLITILLAGRFSASLFPFLDYLINSICLVLMTKHWSDLYAQVCGPLARWLTDSEHCSCLNGHSTKHSSGLNVDSQPPSNFRITVEVNSPTV